MAANRPLLDVETLGPPSTYSYRQIAQACLIAGQCHYAFGAVRFVYTLPPDAPR